MRKKNKFSFLNSNLYVDPGQYSIWIDENNRFGIFLNSDNNNIEIWLGSIWETNENVPDAMICLYFTYSEFLIFEKEINKSLNKISNIYNICFKPKPKWPYWKIGKETNKKTDRIEKYEIYCKNIRIDLSKESYKDLRKGISKCKIFLKRLKHA